MQNRFGGRRCGGRSALLFHTLVFMLPEEQFRPDVIVEAGLQDFYKRLSIHFIESQRRGETHYGGRENKCENYWQICKENNAEANCASDINKLFQGQRPDNLVLHLYKLRNLVLHPLYYNPLPVMSLKSQRTRL